MPTDETYAFPFGKCRTDAAILCSELSGAIAVALDECDPAWLRRLRRRFRKKPDGRRYTDLADRLIAIRNQRREIAPILFGEERITLTDEITLAYNEIEAAVFTEHLCVIRWGDRFLFVETDLPQGNENNGFESFLTSKIAKKEIPD